MCPDRQILSLYHDGELPSPWKEKMEAHLASCQGCRSQLEQYQKLSMIMEGDRIEVLPETEQRVLDRIISQNQMQSYRTTGNPQIWKRNISLPIPLAAAAAAVFVVALLLAVQRGQYPASTPEQGFGPYGITATMGTGAEDMIPMADMNSVLQYLSRQEASDFLFIELPEETRNFSSYGEPAFLKAADYPRRRSHR
jgi:hypothetical protein